MSSPSHAATLTALATAQILSWAALFYGFSSFVGPMQAEPGWTRPVVMGGFTVGLATWGVVAYAVGAGIDRGHGRAVMTGGALAGAAGFFLWSIADGPVAFYAAWVLLGAAQAATLYDAAFAWLARRDPARYRRALTTLTLVGGFASTVSYPAVAALQSAFGWRGALVALGLVMALVVAPLQAWAMRGGDADPPEVTEPIDPAASDDGAPRRVLEGLTLDEALRVRAFWLLTTSFALYAVVSAALWAHVMPALRAAGLDETAALAVLVWFGPAQVAGRALQALVGARWPLRTTGIVVMAILTVSLVVATLGRGRVEMTVFALLFGVANGLVTIVRGALVPAYFGVAHVGRIGGAMGGIGLVLRAVAPIAGAGLLALAPSYAVLLGVLAALSGVSMVLFALARPPRSTSDR